MELVWTSHISRYGLAAIVLHSDTIAKPWPLTQVIFSKLQQHMNVAKENMKETVLVAVGSMGKWVFF